uniref:RNA-directed DNA polymerase n=1 Tax=Phlebotomus papatasi TaxID=29031 RepID=A0A1B0D915_PHLPP
MPEVPTDSIMNGQSGSSDTPTVGCSDGNVGLVLGLREVESMVTSFNPDELSCPEAAEWLTSTEKTCLRYRMTEDQMMIIAGMRLKGAAKLWFEAMKSELNTWNDLKEQLKIYFPKVINIPQINRQLERKKKPEETAEMYVYDKLRLAKRAGTSDAALMQYVIEGIPNSSQRDILKSKDIKTIPELAEAIGKLEAPENSIQKQYSPGRRDKVLTEKSEDRGRSRSRWRDDFHARKCSENEGYDDRSPQRWKKSQSRHLESHKYYRREQRNEHQEAGVSTKREKDSSTPLKAEKDSQKTHKRLCYICRSVEHLAARCPKNKDFRVRLVGAVASRKTNNELLVKIGEKSEVIDAIIDMGSDITIIKDSKMAAMGVRLEGKPAKFKLFGRKEEIRRVFANMQLSVKDITETVRVHVVPDSYMIVSMILEKDEVIILTGGLENDDWVAVSQLRDPDASRIRDVLKGEDQDQNDAKNLEEQYKSMEDRVHKKTPAGFRFYVPNGLKFYVMRTEHNDMGHPALERTLRTLRKTYWCPKMQSMVTKYLKNCVKCEVWQRMYKILCKQAEKYNEVHRGSRKYSKDDLMLLRYNPQAIGSSRKMVPRYRGPYEVQKVLDRDRYVIADTTFITGDPSRGRTESQRQDDLMLSEHRMSCAVIRFHEDIDSNPIADADWKVSVKDSCRE